MAKLRKILEGIFAVKLASFPVVCSRSLFFGVESANEVGLPILENSREPFLLGFIPTGATKFLPTLRPMICCIQTVVGRAKIVFLVIKTVTISMIRQVSGNELVHINRSARAIPHSISMRAKAPSKFGDLLKVLIINFCERLALGKWNQFHGGHCG